MAEPDARLRDPSRGSAGPASGSGHGHGPPPGRCQPRWVHLLPALLPSAVLLAAASPAPEPAGPVPGEYAVVAGESEVAYDVRHPLHGVRGISRDLRGSVVLRREAPYLATPCRLAAPLAAFSSRNRNRDANALTALAAGRFPEAAVTITSVAATTSPERWEPSGTADGLLELRGVMRPVAVRWSARQVSPGTVEVRAGFGFSLAQHRIERPALLLMPIDDGVAIACRLMLRRP